VAVDVREPDLTGPDALRSAYEAKAAAELADADAVLGAAPGSWEGRTVGPRIAFVVGTAASASAPARLLADRIAEALARAADALGAGADVFTIASRPVSGASADRSARRLRLALESVDPPAVIALDAQAAEDLAAAFGLDALRPGEAVRVLGRALGNAGDFAASLDDPPSKARAWSAMKAAAAAAGVEAKGRPKAPQEQLMKPGAPGPA
jgi:hypothetical protein